MESSYSPRNPVSTAVVIPSVLDGRRKVLGAIPVFAAVGDPRGSHIAPATFSYVALFGTKTGLAKLPTISPKISDRDVT